MSWKVGDDGVVMNGNLVAGSIVKMPDGKFQIEILWGGPGGDIKFEAANITAALAFVAGVEQTIDRIAGVMP